MNCRICNRPATVAYCDDHDPSHLLPSVPRVDLKDIATTEKARKVSEQLIDFVLSTDDNNAALRVRVAHDMLLKHVGTFLKGRVDDEDDDPIIEGVSVAK